jgi:hypothetical protein
VLCALILDAQWTVIFFGLALAVAGLLFDQLGMAAACGVIFGLLGRSASRLFQYRAVIQYILERPNRITGLIAESEAVLLGARNVNPEKIQPHFRKTLDQLRADIDWINARLGELRESV